MRRKNGGNVLAPLEFKKTTPVSGYLSELTDLRLFTFLNFVFKILHIIRKMVLLGQQF